MRILVFFISSVLLIVSAVSPALSEPEGLAGFLASRQVMETVYFAYGSARLDDRDIDSLDLLIPKLRDAIRDGRIVRVEGFASPEGKKSSNLRLSMDRAGTVASYLNAKGLPVEAKVTGYGNLNAKQQKAALERRVEIATYRAPAELTKTRVGE